MQEAYIYEINGLTLADLPKFEGKGSAQEVYIYEINGLKFALSSTVNFD